MSEKPAAGQIFVIYSVADPRRLDEAYQGSFPIGEPLPALDDEEADWVSDYMVAYRFDPAGELPQDWRSAGAR